MFYKLLRKFIPVCKDCNSFNMVDISPSSEFRTFFRCRSCGETTTYRARR